MNSDEAVKVPRQDDIDAINIFHVLDSFGNLR